MADFTCIWTWQGLVCVASVVGVYTGRIGGWRFSSSMQTDFVRDALDQVVAYNHPSRADEPSHADGFLTQALAQADVRVLVTCRWRAPTTVRLPNGGLFRA